MTAPTIIGLVSNGLGQWALAHRDEAEQAVIYTRADLPPTLAQALALPEVKSLVEAAEALRNNFGSYKFNSMGDFYCTSEDPEFRQFDEALAAMTTSPVYGEKK